MTTIPSIPWLYTREEVDAGQLLLPLRALDALLTPARARRHRQRLVLGFMGFPPDRQPLFADPTLRAWIHEIDLHWPFWFYFFDPQSPSLRGLALLLCPLVRTTHEWHLPDAAFQHFVTQHLAALDALCGAVGDPPSTRLALQEAVRHALP